MIMTEKQSKAQTNSKGRAIRTPSNKNTLRKNSTKPLDRNNREADEIVVSAIQGLNFFIAQANNAQLGTMARILHTAKEDLVFWATDMEFYESRKEKLLNMLLYNNSLFAAPDLIVNLSSAKERRKLIKALSDNKFNSLPCALITALRQID